MKPSVAPSDYLEQLRELSHPGAGDSAVWAALRHNGLEALEHAVIPTRKSESWRYAGAQRLFQEPFEPVSAAGVGTPIERTQVEEMFCAGTQALRVVLVNGYLMPALSTLEDLPPGVHVGGLTQAGSDLPTAALQLAPGKLIAPGRNVFTAMNAAGMNDGLLLWVEDGVVLDRPIEVLHLGTGGERPQLIQPRNLVRLGRDAVATLMEHYLELVPGSPGFCNAVSEIDIAPGGQLTHLQRQQQGHNTFHLCTEGVRLAQGSRYVGTRFALGGSWARNEIDVHFDGPGAEVDLGGLFTVGDGQFNDIHVNVEHAVAGCHSNARFKGLLHGAGRGVLDGRILVEREAQKTEAHLHNANLMLVDDAEVDTRPTLEIYADEVQCSHGATVGQLDPLHVYYLRSRGLDRATAERLLSLGFARETLERSPYPALSDRIDQALEDRLVKPDKENTGESA